MQIEHVGLDLRSTTHKLASRWKKLFDSVLEYDPNRREFLKGLARTGAAILLREPMDAICFSIEHDPVAAMEKLKPIGAYEIGQQVQDVTTCNNFTFSFTSQDTGRLSQAEPSSRPFSRVRLSGLSRLEAEALGGIVDTNRRIRDYTYWMINMLEKGSEIAVDATQAIPLIAMAVGAKQEVLDNWFKRNKERIKKFSEHLAIGGGVAAVGVGSFIVGYLYLESKRAAYASDVSTPVANLLAATTEIQNNGVNTLTEGGNELPITKATATLLPSATKTPTVTITPKPSFTATETSTPTITLTPTQEMPTPTQIIFNGDFERPIVYNWGAGEWHTPLTYGGRFEVIDDPTDSVDSSGRPRGQVLKCTAEGDAEQTEWGGSEFWRNIYPNWMYGENKTLPAPCGISCDIYIPNDMISNIGLLGVHRLNRKTGDNTSVAGYEIDSSGGLILVTRDAFGNDTRVKLVTPPNIRGQWHTLRLDFVGPQVYPYIDGKLGYPIGIVASEVTVDKDNPAGFFDGHAGIINGNEDQKDGLEGKYILNDNFLIFSLA